jgi:hypothetical protein
MVNVRQCLEVLGLTHQAAMPDWKVIKRARRERLMATHPDRRHGSTDHNEYMRVSAAYSTLLGIHECGKGDRYVPETDSSDEEEECRAPPSTHTAKLSLPTVGTQQCNNTSLVGHKLLLVGEFGELQGGVAALRRWSLLTLLHNESMRYANSALKRRGY